MRTGSHKNMNIWIFNQYAHAHDLPGGTRHFDLALQLKSFGHDVTIFSAGFHYTLLDEMQEYNAEGYRLEKKDGINFLWVKTVKYSSNNYRRLLNILSYSWRLNRIISNVNFTKPDIIIGSTVHPFAGLLGSKLAKKFSVPFIFEIRDLWPQTFIDMGIWKRNDLKSIVFRMIEKITVRSSDSIIVLSPMTKIYLRDVYNYDIDKVLLLPNGVTDKFFKDPEQVLDGPIKIYYVGGIDLVHGLDFLIDLARELCDQKIEFHLYGDGKQRLALEDKVLNYGLSNVFFHGSISKTSVPNVLNKANLLFVSTSNVLYGSENKLYEYMAAGKPIVVAGSGSHNNPIETINCGVTLNRNDVKEASKALTDFIYKNSSNFEILGKNGQNYVTKNRKLEVLGKNLEIFLANTKKLERNKLK